MKAKTLLVFALSVTVCALAASYRFYDSAHTLGVIKADGGTARHPILLDQYRDSYTIIATATVLPPYRGNARVVVEGVPAMDYVVHVSESAVHLNPYRHPLLRGNVLYDLRPKDKVALWVVMKPKPGEASATATSGSESPPQEESCHPSGESDAGSAVAAPPGGASSGASDRQPGKSREGGTRTSGRPHGKGAAQRLAFYDTATGKAVLTVPILYQTRGERAGEHEGR